MDIDSMRNLRRSLETNKGYVILVTVARLMLACAASVTHAADHLDTPTVAADPRVDIGDVYAWMAPNGRQLNLVMTIVGKTFAEKHQYSIYVDSGKRIGKTTATTSIVCGFPADHTVECRVGEADYAFGDASRPAGLLGQNKRFRVFAGLRDDPYFNNVRGTRAAYNVAAAAIRNGAATDAAGCPAFDRATSREIFAQWKKTDGGPGTNFLAGWTSSALVITIDLNVVDKGGKLLAIWATTSSEKKQLDRMGRPLTANALLGTLDTREVSIGWRERYNAATPATSAPFIAEIQKWLGLYDGFDGRCGNQFLANAGSLDSSRYRKLATLLADDRLWVNSASSICTQLFAVELANLAGRKPLQNDCGGRKLKYNANNVYRSLLVDGTNTSVDDGVTQDDQDHPDTVFPFLAAPTTKSENNSRN